MRKLVLFLLALLLAPALFAQAPVQTPSNLLATFQPLNQGWLYHYGDDPAFAQPDYPDSGWQPVSVDGGTSLGPAGIAWFRYHLHLPASRPSMSLELRFGDAAAEVYLNGQKLPSTTLGPLFRQNYAHDHAIPLPDNTTDILIALRVFKPAYIAAVSNQETFTDAILGPSDGIQARTIALAQNQALRIISSVDINLALCLGGIAAFALFLTQRTHREYLWLAAYLFLLGFSDLLLVLTWDNNPFVLNAFAGDPLDWITYILQIQFTLTFIQEPIRRRWRAYQLVNFAFFLLGFYSNASGHLSNFYYLAESVLAWPASILLCVLLIRRSRQGNREAGWLILPTLLLAATGTIFEIHDFATIKFQSNFLDWLAPTITFTIGRVGYRTQALANLAYLLAIGVVLFLRHARLTQSQAKTAAELNAAREVQQNLVPASLPPTPAFRIAAAYLPAAEVGGDFYQIFPLPNDAVLLVIGDVSGKGLKAAMTGILAIGSLRTLAAESLSPAHLLTRLNAQLAQTHSGGFTTCLVLHITPSGTVTAANAGHIPPYLNGTELDLAHSLPLGLAPDATYTESQFQLPPNHQLTLLTDGVPEAQKPSAKSASGDLFGFDRTAAISTQSAHSIAQTAQSWGQSDDITVLTLTLTT